MMINMTGETTFPHIALCEHIDIYTGRNYKHSICRTDDADERLKVFILSSVFILSTILIVIICLRNKSIILIRR